MKYYLHDTSAFEDEKITMLFLKFGYEGIGLFYTILEKLAKQEKPINTLVLKSQLKVGKRLEKRWAYMEEIGIISSNNGETFNEQLLNYSEKYRIKKEKTREKVMQWRKNQEDKNNVTGYIDVCNTPKVKESKVKESKEENILPKNSFLDRAKIFYNSELQKTKDENYKIFVEFLFGNNHTKKPFPKVLKLENQLSYESFCQLMAKCSDAKIKFLDMVLELENYKGADKKYKDMYLTLNTWINRRINGSNNR